MPSALTASEPFDGLVCRATVVAPLSFLSTSPVTGCDLVLNESSLTLKSCEGAENHPLA